MSATLTAEVEIGIGEPTALYRLYAKDGVLLYVGISRDLARRLAQHAAEKPWWPEVTRKTALLYPSRQDALQAEAEAIALEGPLHNTRNLRGHTRRARSPRQGSRSGHRDGV